MTTTALTAALDALAQAGTAAGVAAQAARTEGERLAAAVAESSPGAPADWLAATASGGSAARVAARPTASTLQPFFDAAVSARRWRSAPTDLLAGLIADNPQHAPSYADALAAVVDAAATLGDPSISAIAAAEGTKAVHRSAAAGRDKAPQHPTTPEGDRTGKAAGSEISRPDVSLPEGEGP
ncbi:AAA family ATPase, partial [Promicromonospora sp. NPDC059942]